MKRLSLADYRESIRIADRMLTVDGLDARQKVAFFGQSGMGWRKAAEELGRRIDARISQRIDMLFEIQLRVGSLFSDAGCKQWFNAQQEFLANYSPKDLLVKSRGDIEVMSLVLRFINLVTGGQPSFDAGIKPAELAEITRNTLKKSRRKHYANEVL
jgi:hypothetical protein